jgi:hypothetical protein
MADLTVNAAKIRPLDGATVRKATLGGALGVGDWVKLQLDGTIIKQAGASDMAWGQVVALSNKGSSGVSGVDEASVVVFGPVAGYSGLNPGRLGYLSANAGKIADAGSKAAGYAESATVFFVMPGVSVAAS